MEKNRKAIQQELGMLAFYMQGGLGFNEAHMLSLEQRQILSKVIQRHYEAMDPKKKSML